MRKARSLFVLCIVCVVVCSFPSAYAQEAQRIVKEPPLLRAGALKAKTLMALPETLEVEPDAAGETELDLDIVYTSGTLWNPATRTKDKVRLRSYQGEEIDPDNPYISPKIEVDPGDTIRVTLNNQLDKDPTCISSASPNTPHCFNGTNLHTHGLWVNPAGNGDNVLISINPGVSFQYEYKLPPDHPAGTFWYHTHRHGSTALQVSSGMAGALIVRGKRFPRRNADGKIESGDLDTLLRPTAAQSFRERTVVLQQIQYACRDANGKIKRNADGTYKCEAGDVGGIESYDDFGPGGWRKSGRYTSINGQVLPTFVDAKAGQIERWRVIHGGVRDTIALQFRALRSGAPSADGLAAAANDAFVGANCTGDALTQHVVAADGLAVASVMKRNSITFQPGYRWDSLVVFPKPGVYCVIDTDTPAAASVDAADPSRQLLGFVLVGPGSDVSGDLTAYVTAQLANAARTNMPMPVRAAVEADIRNGLKLTSFVPHADIPDGTYGTQTLTFNIDTSVSPNEFQVNDKPYDPNRLDRTLTLGTIDEWTLSSKLASHPFHIHINPFQIVKILDPNGKDVSAPDAVDGTDTQYPGLKGVWKDTVWVKRGTGPYTIVFRTRYQRYIGDFVLHCHILDHEDQGMMQNVRIALPDGSGGTAEHAH